jgi:hypothetical protein
MFSSASQLRALKRNKFRAPGRAAAEDEFGNKIGRARRAVVKRRLTPHGFTGGTPRRRKSLVSMSKHEFQTKSARLIYRFCMLSGVIIPGLLRMHPGIVTDLLNK